MAKRRKPRTSLVPRMTYWPQDWMPRIHAARGEMDFGEFVRQCVLKAIDDGTLSANPRRGRPAQGETNA